MKDKKQTEKYTEFYKVTQPMDLPLAQIIAQRLRDNLKRMSGIVPAKYRREYGDRGKREWANDIRKMIYALEELYFSRYLDEGKNLSSEMEDVGNKSSKCETNLEKIKNDEGMKLLQENCRSWVSIDLDWFNLFSKRRLDSDDKSISFQSKELDRLTNGLHKGELLVVGARPAMGKTSFGIYLANVLSMKLSISGVFISFEQNVKQLANSFSRYDMNSLMYDNKSEIGYPGLAKVQNHPLFLVGISSMRIEELSERLNYLVKHQHIQYAIIDYVQLINGRKDIEYTNRDEELKDVLLQLKSIAVELQIPIITASQINRTIDNSSRVPDPSCFPQQVFCPADTILALHRPEYYTLYDEVNKLKVILIQHPYQTKGEIILGFKDGLIYDIDDTKEDMNTEIYGYHFALSKD